ncbi:hypothetical protein DXV65_24620 [Pseudomonas fluorescens]|nr:hypothetical protein DXV65_24620 [Pseudomonas fluorescens]
MEIKNVGAGLPAIAVDQSIKVSTVRPLSQASQLPQGSPVLMKSGYSRCSGLIGSPGFTSS